MSRKARRQAAILHARKMSEMRKTETPRERELRLREARVSALEAEQEKVHALVLRHDYAGTSAELFARRGNPWVTRKEQTQDEKLASTCQSLTGDPRKDKMFRILEAARLRRQRAVVEVKDEKDLKNIQRTEAFAWTNRKRLMQQHEKERRDERLPED